MKIRKMKSRININWGKLFLKSPYVFLGIFTLGFLIFSYFIELEYSVFSTLIKQYFGS